MLGATKINEASMLSKLCTSKESVLSSIIATEKLS
jgi:hypothetical protein